MYWKPGILQDSLLPFEWFCEPVEYGDDRSLVPVSGLKGVNYSPASRWIRVTERRDAVPSP